jgi:N-acetylmuramoyl-L-alanine amidase
VAGWHEVKQGETFSSIADTYGFQNYKTLYDHAENADLRHMRPNPDVIFPGDQIYVPDFEPKELPAATDQLHRYVLTFRPKVVRIRLQDFNGKAVPNAACELHVGPDVFTGSTDGDGVLEQRVPVQARRHAEDRRLRVDLEDRRAEPHPGHRR